MVFEQGSEHTQLFNSHALGVAVSRSTPHMVDVNVECS